jgi:hypothetical protein
MPALQNLVQALLAKYKLKITVFCINFGVLDPDGQKGPTKKEKN